MTEEEVLGEAEFSSSIALLPLVSIDLLVESKAGDFLLGKRENPPAKDYWFVPGGRIRRMESFSSAFQRISLNELGGEFLLENSEFIGVFQHMYGDSAFSEETGSHYVSIALKINGESLKLSDLPRTQHRKFRWFSEEEISVLDSIHDRTKEFFIPSSGIRPR